jgi:hypothetical protein
MTVEPSPEQVVLNLLKGVVRERSDEIDAIWQRYAPKVIVGPTGPGIRLEADKDGIVVDPKTMEVFWLVGFAGWRAIETYSPHVIVSAASGQSLAQLFQDDDELPQIEHEYKARLAIAQQLIAAADPASMHWPPDLPRPSSDRDAFDGEQYKVAFDLTCMAVAFTLLHELKHVMLDKDNARPSDRREEEMICDVFARDFMTAKLAAYAQTHNHAYSKVLEKRSMGLTLAALILHEITPLLEQGGNKQYFSLASRLQAMVDNTPLQPDSHFWVFAASLLIGIQRQRFVPIALPSSSALELTRELIALV